MKILFINRYESTGGAAIVARRLASALRAEHHCDVRFLVGTRSSNSPDVLETRRAGPEEVAERGINVVTSALGLQYVFFPFSTARIRRFVKEWQPDVISAHNLHGGFFELGLLEELSASAPVVWTMHDMWAFTASSAHTFGNDAWKQLMPGPNEHRQVPWIGLPNGRWLMRRKQRIYSRSRLTFIGPSAWIAGEARQSPLLAGKSIVHIPNGVDVGVYTPHRSAALRSRRNIPADAWVIAFAAEKVLASSHKGGALLVEILRHIDERAERAIHLLVLGKRAENFPREWKRLHVHVRGYVTDEQAFVEELSMTDVYLHPSKADTFPTTLLEAAACGVPAVTSLVGGCPEIVRDGASGYCVEGGDPLAFATKVLDLLRAEERRRAFAQAAVAHVRDHFTLRGMAERYVAIFRSVSTERSR